MQDGDVVALPVQRLTGGATDALPPRRAQPRAPSVDLRAAPVLRQLGTELGRPSAPESERGAGVVDRRRSCASARERLLAALIRRGAERSARSAAAAARLGRRRAPPRPGRGALAVRSPASALRRSLAPWRPRVPVSLPSRRRARRPVAAARSRLGASGGGAASGAAGSGAASARRRPRRRRQDRAMRAGSS